jgi:hypothetical protein
MNTCRNARQDLHNSKIANLLGTGSTFNIAMLFQTPELLFENLTSATLIFGRHLQAACGGGARSPIKLFSPGSVSSLRTAL